MSTIDKMKGVVNEAVTLAIRGMSRVPGVRPDPQAVMADLKQAGAKLKSIDDISQGAVPTKVLDGLADHYLMHQSLLAAGAGLTGFFGAPGVAGSIGGLIATTVGLAYRLALVYGFDDVLKPGNEDLVLIGLGAAAGIDWLATPFFTGLGAGALGAVIWLGPAASQATAEVVAQAVSEGVIEEALAPALAEEILSEGMASTVVEMIPFVGGAVGAIANTTFLRIWGKRMSTFYRDQHKATLQALRATKTKSASSPA